MADELVISVDAMGGDFAPQSVIDGIAKAHARAADLNFLLHGDQTKLAPLLRRKPELKDYVEIRHTDQEIPMDAKPSLVVRRGRESSMWRCIEAVREGEAKAAVSAGNTGALMAMALFCLRAAEGVDRPAIAAFWPSRAPQGHTVVLDMGADVRADAHDLLQYAVMGAEYARVALQVERPRVALLNVGVEDGKGRSEVKDAAALLRAAQAHIAFDYEGFIEGDAIFSGEADVVVTDGFTGNAALKSAEGAAKLIADFLREAFEHSLLSRLGSMFAYTSMRRFKARIDPRRVNGGVFLGLNGLVVKSHGGADATGFAAALMLAADMARIDFGAKIAVEVAKAALAVEDERRK